jgi:hypothetical protein
MIRLFFFSDHFRFNYRFFRALGWNFPKNLTSVQRRVVSLVSAVALRFISRYGSATHTVGCFVEMIREVG